MPSSKGFKSYGIELPEDLQWTNEKFRVFIVLLIEYMGIQDEDDQTAFLEKYPSFSNDFDEIEQYQSRLKDRLIARGVIAQ